MCSLHVYVQNLRRGGPLLYNAWKRGCHFYDTVSEWLETRFFLSPRITAKFILKLCGQFYELFESWYEICGLQL